MKAHLALSMSVFLLVGGLVSAAPVVLHVATDGDDGALGDAEHPLRTLTGARNRLRQTRPADGAVINVHPGDYLLDEPLTLTEQDSASPGKRIVYRAVEKGSARLMGGVEIAGFKPYRQRILRADVSSLDLHTIPSPKFSRFSGDIPGFEIFFEGRRMPLARWPNRDFDHPRWGDWALIPKTTARTRQWFHYPGTRPDSWRRPQEAQVHWFPYYNYMDQYVGISSIDVNKKAIHLDGQAVYEIQPGRRFYIRNVFEELDAPGEWYFDKAEKHLYFFPPSPLTEGRVVASRAEHIVMLDGVARTTLSGFVIEACSGDAVVVHNGTENSIAACVIRNTFRDGIAILGGTNHAAVGNDIHHVGRRGVLLSGGDRQTLTDAKNLAENNHIHHVSRILHTYAPAIQITGCGNRVRHNQIHDGPHMVIGLAGNNHLVEYNDVSHAMSITSHGGAFYCGRDLTARGNVIRYNAFHDIAGYGFDHIDTKRGVFVYSSPVRRLPGAFGIHLDDQISGFHIYGNLFYRLAHGVIRAGGGRDNRIENNVFVDAGWAVHIDNRGMGWQKKQLENPKSTLLSRLGAVPYREPPWSTRYPELVDVRTDRFGEPVDNVVMKNIFYQRTRLYNFSRVPRNRFTCDYNCVWNPEADITVSGRLYPKGGGVIPFEQWQKLGFDTHSVVGDPRFADPQRDDYRVLSDSPALKLGFKQIPQEKIGLYEHETRASTPPGPDSRKLTGGDQIEEYPIPGFVPPTPQRTVVKRIPMTADAITVDGHIEADEWGPKTGEHVLHMKTDYRGQQATVPSQAFVMHDGETLFIAVRNPMPKPGAISKTADWGQDDAVEIALQPVTDNPGEPTVVLRGFANGTWYSSHAGGAEEDLVNKTNETVRYAARMIDSKAWEAEWAIPLASIPVPLPRPANEPRLRCNVTTFKKSVREWIMWMPTHGDSYRIEQHGILILTVPHGG